MHGACRSNAEYKSREGEKIKKENRKDNKGAKEADEG